MGMGFPVRWDDLASSVAVGIGTTSQQRCAKILIKVRVELAEWVVLSPSIAVFNSRRAFFAVLPVRVFQRPVYFAAQGPLEFYQLPVAALSSRG